MQFLALWVNRLYLYLALICITMNTSVKTESLHQFYQRTGQPLPADLLNSEEDISHFNVKKRTFLNRLSPYNRRDYYKICLIIGDGVHQAGETETLIKGAGIIFSNPSVPSSYRATSSTQSGYYCLFNDPFLSNSVRQDIMYQSPLFNRALPPVIALSNEEADKFSKLFGEMELLLAGNYMYKNEMIRSILQLVILEGIRIQLPGPGWHINDGLTARFFGLLNQQFPVDSPENPLKLLTPAAYADKLSIHVNHLNNVVKRTIGKTTREIIHERIVQEAKTLLLNTDWDASQIAYSLGFEYPSHFNKYFKQYSMVSPLLFRNQARHSA